MSALHPSAASERRDGMFGLSMIARAVGTPLVGIGVAIAVARVAWRLTGDFLLDRIDLPGGD